MPNDAFKLATLVGGIAECDGGDGARALTATGAGISGCWCVSSCPGTGCVAGDSTGAKLINGCCGCSNGCCCCCCCCSTFKLTFEMPWMISASLSFGPAGTCAIGTVSAANIVLLCENVLANGGTYGMVASTTGFCATPISGLLCSSGSKRIGIRCK